MINNNNLKVFIILEMVVKIKEYFEKTKHVKKNDKSKKIFYVDKEMYDIMKEFYLII